LTRVAECDVPANVTVEDGRRFEPFIVSVCELEPARVVEGETLAMLGTGLAEGGGGGGVELPPAQPDTKPIRTIREMNHVRLGFQTNRICR
jgi:hypothetical protein